MKNRKGNLLMTLGLVLILAALALVGYNQWDASRAQQESDDALMALDSHSAADGIAANRCTARSHRDDDADGHTDDGCADNRRADGGCHCGG